MGLLAELLAKPLAKLLVKTSSSVLPKLALIFKPILLKAGLLVSAITFAAAHGGESTIGSRVLSVLGRQILLNFFESDETRAAALVMEHAIYEALRWCVVALEATACLFVVFLLIIGGPLATRATWKRRPYIFLSFQHQLEALATAVDQALAGYGFRTYRLPYRPEATHQQVVTETNRALRRCDAVVCLPGRTESYVEIEVSAATHGFKPIAFAVPSHGGTLPNSADKRYPVFRLEAIEKEQYQPLGEFLHYVIGDLASGVRQVWKSARHPFVVVSSWAAVAVLCAMLFALFLVAHSQASTATEAHAAQGGAFAEARDSTVIAVVGILVGLGAVVLTVTGYTLVVVVGVWRQRGAQRRASLKAGAADFARDDWVGVIPDMGRGSTLYECLFDIAPPAHHEAQTSPA